MPDARREGMTAEDAEELRGSIAAPAKMHNFADGDFLAAVIPLHVAEHALATYHALAASQQEVERLRAEQVTRAVDALPDGTTLIKTDKLDALRVQLAAAREDSTRLREQLRLANIDAANNEAEASDLRAERAGDRPLARGTVYGWAAGQMSIVGDPSVPLGEIQIRDDDGRVLMRIVGFDTARSTDAERTHGGTP